MLTSSFSALPLWLQSVLLALILIFVLLFLFMPFAVYGIKGRLREVELRLEEIRTELQIVTFKLGKLEPVRQTEWEPPHVAERPAPEFHPPGQPQPAKAQTPEKNNVAYGISAQRQDEQSSVQSHEKKPDPVAREKTVHPAAERLTPVASGLRAERAADAWETRDVTPPEPLNPTGSIPRSTGRMPWHSPAGRPSRSEPSVSFSDQKSDETTRSEPVLRWPVRHHHDQDSPEG